MEAATVRAALVAEDWATRERIESVQLQLLEIVDCLNRFHATTKARLVLLADKLTSVEQRLRHVELAVRASHQAPSAPQELTVHK